jgi:hypothetical protein
MWWSPPKLSKAGLYGPINTVLTCVHMRYPVGYGTSSFDLARNDTLNVITHIAISARRVTFLRLANRIGFPTFS